MDILNSLVEDLLRQHEGGSVFFDNLDAALRDECYIDELINLIMRYNSDIPIALSGTFGKLFYYYTHNLGLNLNMVVLNGGLRKNKLPTILHGIIKPDSPYHFVDDSIYSCKTKNVVSNVLQVFDSYIVNTFVLYDGSPLFNPHIHSLYRYYK